MQHYSFYKMKVFFIVYICSLNIAGAQVLLDMEHNAPIEGHAICKQKIHSSTILSDKVIDLTKVDVLPEKQNVVYFKETICRNENVILSCLDGDKIKKFSVIEDTLYLQSIENNQGKILYGGNGAPYMFSFELGDKLSFQDKEKHEYVDKISYNGEGHGVMSMQGGISIITPEGDTLTDVVNLQTEIKARLCIKNQEVENVKLTQRYFAKGYRYPIIEVQSEKLGNMKSYEAYYYPKETLEQLYSDWDNKIIRDRLHNTDVLSKQDRPFFNYQIGRYDASNGFTIKCKSQEKCKVRFILTTLGGVVIYVKNVICPKNTECSFVLDVPGLGMGTYVLYLNNDNQVISETVNVS